MSRRKMRTQALWNVEAHTSRASSPSIRSRRSFSSVAALLVNVMASTSQGLAGSTAQRYSISGFWAGSGSRIYPSRNSTSSPVMGMGISSVSLPRPYFNRLATRLISTVVLPLPAPASSSSGPSVVSTPWRCLSFSLPYSMAMACRRAAINLFSSSVISLYPQALVFVISIVIQNPAPVNSQPRKSKFCSIFA